MEDILVIIDGNSLVNRAFFAIQRPMITSSGFYTQGIYGFLSMLRKIETDYAPTHMLVAFDRKAPTFRHKEYSEYKAGRKGMPEELAMEMPVLKDVLHARGIRTYEIDGFEADDIIGTTAAMAEEAGMRSYIITGDRDALQLATDLTSVVITKKGISEFKLYDDAAMIEEYGFDHLQFIDYKGLRGDTSDNIPGIPGVGEKTAIKLIQQFGSIENMIKNSDQIESEKLREKIEENAMAAMMSKRLATIVKSVPVDYTLEELKKRPVEREKLIELYKTLEFNVFLKQLLSEAPADAGAAAGEAVKAAADFGRAEVLGGAAEAAALLKRAAGKGSVVIDVESDDDHIGIPAAKSLCFEFEGRYYAAAPREGLTEALVEALSGKKTGLRGFGLGKLYFLLLRNGADISGLRTEFDCALADYVISPTAKADSLEVLLLREFGYAKKGAEASAQQDMFSAPADEIDPADAASVLGLLKELETRQRERVEKNGLSTVLYDIELPLCKVLASMEAEGIRLDTEELAEFGKSLKTDIKRLENEIYEEAGEVFNINSPMQLGTILFDKLGLPGGKKTKKGWSTSADILEKLADRAPIISKILEYRTLSKLNSTYVEGLIPLAGEDGKVRAHFRQTVTSTGRISCTEPNLQNIPVRSELGRQLRKAFTTDSPDKVLIGADYSQIELRVLAHMSKDPTLIKAFNDGLDIHRETASKVFGVPQEEVTPQMRSNAKAVNFGVIYGMSSFGLADELTITRKQAEKYISDYFERFKDVKLFMDGCVESAKRDGSIRTLYGRIRQLPEIHARDYMQRQFGERLAMNTPIQGTAADIIKLAMIKVFDALAKECPKSRLILQIHDELIIQADRREAEKAARILSESMTGAAELAVKLDISQNTGDNWYELK